MNFRRHLLLPILAACACLAAVQARAGSGAGGAPEHQGFYFNTDVGPAATHVTFSGPRDNLDVRAAAAEVDLRFGYAITPHFVLSLDLSGMATANKPDTTLNGADLRCGSDSYYGTSALGVGLTWYSDSNLFAGLTLGSGRVTQNVNNTNINSDNGFAVQARVGKEWWVGEDWGLGVVGGLGYVSAGADIRESVISGSGGTYTAYFDHADASTVFVAFTATFN